MGGQGSGRLPGVNALVKQNEEVRQPVADSMFLPNVSSVQPSALKGSGVDLAGGGGTDVKVAVDSGATADYLGAASNDGVLRTGATIWYVDGGNFVTLSVSEAVIDHTAIQNIGTNSHSQIDTHLADVTGDPHNIEADTLTFTNKTIDDFSNHVEADEIHEELRNESGADMTRGDAVYISGYSVGQERALVTLADSSVAGTMPAIAILEDATLANNATGHFIENGNLMDMDTNSWNVGDGLYVSETGTTTNTLTNTKPTGAALVQKVAVVLRKHASNGVIEIFGAGRSNDLPNIADTKLWIGDTNGVPQEFTLSGDATMTAGGVVTIDHVNINSIGTTTHANLDILNTNYATTSAAYIAHAADSTDPHGTALTQGNLSISTSAAQTGDITTSHASHFHNVIFGTDATPGVASGFTQGSVYLQYTV